MGSGVTSWKAHSDTLRRFVAFRGDNFPKPAFDGVVEPTNLHGVERADLVIVTRPLFMEAAQRLANLHADEGLTVLLTTQRAVFDEFSSGSVDPTAIKMLMMMLRDRSLEGGWEPPRYLQLFGDGTFANRTNLEASPYIITYQSENSLSPTGSYVSDDYFGFLEDQYGEGLAINWPLESVESLAERLLRRKKWSIKLKLTCSILQPMLKHQVVSTKGVETTTGHGVT